MKLQDLITRYEKMIANVQWHIKTNKPDGNELEVLNERSEAMTDFLTELQSIESPSPIEQMREALEKSLEWVEDGFNGQTNVDIQDKKGMALYHIKCLAKAALSPQDEQKGTGWVSVEEENKQLKAWKQEAMRVMADFQEIGKEIGVPLGQSIGDKILPYIRSKRLYTL